MLATRTRKVKTSVSLSEGLLQAVDALAGKASRSAWIERSVRASVQRALRRRRDENDVRLLNEHAESLNRESADGSPSAQPPPPPHPLSLSPPLPPCSPSLSPSLPSPPSRLPLPLSPFYGVP